VERVVGDLHLRDRLGGHVGYDLSLDPALVVSGRPPELEDLEAVIDRCAGVKTDLAPAAA